MKVLNKVIVACYDIFQTLGAIILAVIIVTVTMGIVSRYVFNHAFAWTEEVCAFMLVYLAYTTAPLATISKEHVVADFFKSLLSKNFEQFLSVVIRVFEVVFFVVVGISCIHYIPRRTWASPILRIPRAAYYVPILTGTVVMCFSILMDMLNDLFPGYNYFMQRKTEQDKEVAMQEHREMEEVQQRMDTFMDEVEKTEREIGEGS